jgi:hypothetical protein
LVVEYEEQMQGYVRLMLDCLLLQNGVPLDALQATLVACFKPSLSVQSPTPYMKQDPLSLTASEVAALVEVVCGKAHPAAASAVTGLVEQEADPLLYWRGPALPGRAHFTNCFRQKNIVRTW